MMGIFTGVITENTTTKRPTSLFEEAISSVQLILKNKPQEAFNSRGSVEIPDGFGKAPFNPSRVNEAIHSRGREGPRFSKERSQFIISRTKPKTRKKTSKLNLFSPGKSRQVGRTSEIPRQVPMIEEMRDQTRFSTTAAIYVREQHPERDVSEPAIFPKQDIQAISHNEF